MKERSIMRRTILLGLSILILAAVPAAAQMCAPGYFGPGGAAPCEPCSPGEYTAVPGSEACNLCPVGTFNPDEGAVACQACPEGTYQDQVGSAECLLCPEGTIAPFTGSAACQPCPPGYTSNASRTECVEEAVANTPMSWGLLKARYL